MVSLYYYNGRNELGKDKTHLNKVKTSFKKIIKSVHPFHYWLGEQREEQIDNVYKEQIEHEEGVTIYNYSDSFTMKGVIPNGVVSGGGMLEPSGILKLSLFF